jgi:hypothetical protein
MLTVVTLWYDDDLALMSCDRSELEHHAAFQTINCVCAELGMCVKASKTKFMAIVVCGIICCSEGQGPW